MRAADNGEVSRLEGMNKASGAGASKEHVGDHVVWKTWPRAVSQLFCCVSNAGWEES